MLKNKILFTSLFFAYVCAPIMANQAQIEPTETNDKILQDINEDMSFKIKANEELDKFLFNGDFIIKINNAIEKVELPEPDYDEENSIYSFDINLENYDIKLSDEVNITFNIGYKGDKINQSFDVILYDEDFEVDEKTPDNINTFGKKNVEMVWNVDGIDSKKLKQLEINGYLNDEEMTILKKNNTIVMSIPVSNLTSNNENYKYRLEIPGYKTVKGYLSIYDEPYLSSLRLSNRYLKMHLGERNSLYAIKNPIDYDCTPRYYSSDEDIVEVNDKGNLKANGEGKAIITVRCDNKKAKAVIDVTNKPEKVLFKNRNNFIEVGDTKEIEFKVYPEEATLNIDDLYLHSSNFLIAAIDGNKLKAYNEGQVEIKYNFNHKDYKATFDVIPKVEEIITNFDDEYKIKVGEEKTINARTMPVDLTRYIVPEFTAGGDNIKVTKNLIKGIKEGTTYINVKFGEHERNVKITVTPKDEDLNDFSMNNKTINLNLGDTFNISDSIILRGCDYKDLSFSTDNNNIMIVGNMVKATNKGSSLITIKSKTTTHYLEVKIN